MPNVYSKVFNVTADAIDNMGHVNNLVYLEWCLQIAEEHWKSAASDEFQKNYIWYVLEHHIKYLQSAFEGDTLRLETWVASAEGVRSERRFALFRESDGKQIVEAHTLWCLLNARTQKPSLITEEIRNLFQ